MCVIEPGKQQAAPGINHAGAFARQFAQLRAVPNCRDPASKHRDGFCSWVSWVHRVNIRIDDDKVGRERIFARENGSGRHSKSDD